MSQLYVGNVIKEITLDGPSKLVFAFTSCDPRTNGGVNRGVGSIAIGPDGAIYTKSDTTTTGWVLVDAATIGGGIANSILTAVGDIIYASAANTPARLGGNITAVRQFLSSTGTGSAAQVPAYSALAQSDLPISAWVALVDGATITQAAAGIPKVRGSVTIAGNRTLAITGAVNGSSGILLVTQGAGGSHGLTLPAGSKQVGGGGTAAALSTSAAAVDQLTWEYDGTTFWFTVGKALA